MWSYEHLIVDKKRMKFYEIFEIKNRMHIPVYSTSTRWARRPHAEKLLSASLNILIISRKSEKSYAYRSFTFVCQLYCCSSKHNNTKALRITFNSCKTVSTSSLALARVSIDKIIKVTSASSYVYDAYCGTYVQSLFVLNCFMSHKLSLIELNIGGR